MTNEALRRLTPGQEEYLANYSRKYQGGLTDEEMSQFADSESTRVFNGIPQIDVLGLRPASYRALRRSFIQTVEGFQEAISRGIFPRTMGITYLSETITKYNQFAEAGDRDQIDLEAALKNYQASRRKTPK